MSGLPTWMQDNIATIKRAVPTWLVTAVDARPDAIQLWNWLAKIEADSARRMTFPDEQALDLLAYDIADAMDRGEYGMGEIAQSDIFPALPAMLAAALAHAMATDQH